MKKLSLSLVTSSILLSMLLTPVHTETVQAKEVENTVDLTKKLNKVKKNFKKQTNNDETNELDTKVIDTKEIDTKITKIESVGQLRTYLAENYPELKTDIITVKFNYSVGENNSMNLPYDFSINYNMELSPWDLNFEAAMEKHLRLIDHQDTAKEDVAKARKQLYDFIETMAKDIIEKLPNKKIIGQDRDDWYRYPNLKIDPRSRTSHSWTNYEPINMKYVWIDRPEDYNQVMRDNIQNPFSPIVIQYTRDEKQRIYYAGEWISLKYNDVKLTDFSWRKHLDEY
ncbi:hypothetical protein [Lysinibacillus capsici]|uniref:hypothetical protein n=1 Tax=Lysinibacillus capsici TaxID=2115968 RepID=UPI000E20A6AE|nr:hypothetical protein [Lysinibacillus capsici]RDV29975.1 hypothetical protein C7B89_17280 [Lysinibacillus capsici]